MTFGSGTTMLVLSTGGETARINENVLFSIEFTAYD